MRSPYRLPLSCGSFPPVLDFAPVFQPVTPLNWMSAMSSPDLEEALRRSEELATRLIESSRDCIKLARC